MSPTETYAELEELEDLLSQYNKAKAMDDKNRLKVIFGMIIEKAKEANLYKEFSDPDEIIDYLHEQLTLIRETQIREGLHVLGKAPEGDKLVNLLVGIMRFDAGKNPSIRRAILEAMDLDYDEIVDDPKGFNETFGKTNGELLNDSTHMAINIMRKVLEEVLS